MAKIDDFLDALTDDEFAELVEKRKPKGGGGGGATKHRVRVREYETDVDESFLQKVFGIDTAKGDDDHGGEGKKEGIFGSFFGQG